MAVMDIDAAKAVIVGSYDGTGHGIFPTISDFDYQERVIFEASPKGFVIYSQTTKNLRDGSAMHQERGYLRILGDASVELLVVQPTGIAEVSTGVLSLSDEGVVLDLIATGILVSPSAKTVSAIRRYYLFSQRGLNYHLDMATETEPLQLHLDAKLIRQVPPQ